MNRAKVVFVGEKELEKDEKTQRLRDQRYEYSAYDAKKPQTPLAFTGK